MAMTPAASPHQRTEHVLYARLVLEASIRRQVAQLGARINQWVPVIAAGRVDTTDAAAALQRTLAELTHRMSTLAARASAAAIDAPPTAAWGSENVPSAGLVTGSGCAGARTGADRGMRRLASVRTEALARLVSADFALARGGRHLDGDRPPRRRRRPDRLRAGRRRTRTHRHHERPGPACRGVAAPGPRQPQPRHRLPRPASHYPVRAGAHRHPCRGAVGPGSATIRPAPSRKW